MVIVTLNRFPDLLSRFFAENDFGGRHGIVVRDGAAESPVPPGWTVVDGVDPFIFARNANIGCDLAKDRDVLLVNDDVTGITPRKLDQLEAVACDFPRFGILAPLVRGPVGQSAQRTAPGRMEAVEVVPIDFVCFVCVLIRRNVLDQIRFDENLDGYGYDDNDLCFRARRSGSEVGVVWGVEIEHREGSTSFRRRWGARLGEIMAKNFRRWEKIRREVIRGK